MANLKLLSNMTIMIAFKKINYERKLIAILNYLCENNRFYQELIGVRLKIVNFYFFLGIHQVVICKTKIIRIGYDDMI